MFMNLSRTTHKLNTTLSEAREAVVADLRRSLHLSLVDLLSGHPGLSMSMFPVQGCTAVCDDKVFLDWLIDPAGRSGQRQAQDV